MHGGNHDAKKRSAKQRTPAIMLQGTSSNAGKSVLTAALCRILLQDGISVAPFKAQNMSLNSHVTHDGLEMGRAQVTQAVAAGLEPDVRMNPVLLKPSSDTGAQILLRGLPIGSREAQTCTSYRTEAFGVVKECYDSLADEYDAIVLEGAGSPAEVNLKQDDIVNMNMARYAESPVLLVGDIDRGGVFASFIGTHTIFSEWERELLAGFVINRFRGDRSLLQSALEITEDFTGKPTIGIIDYLPDLALPEEDSVEFRLAASCGSSNHSEPLEVCLVDLPHISNFTDIDALKVEPDISLSILRQDDRLGSPDLVILPGSKNVISDLTRLRESGRTEELRNYHAAGGSIIGICGGFQMLGDTIEDPHGVESSAGSIDGLKLLRLHTVLAEKKTLQLTRATVITSGEEVAGYEIHHGQSRLGGDEVWLTSDSGETCGVVSACGRIWGTYIHGIFDRDCFRRRFLDAVRLSKGMTPVEATTVYDINAALDRLAAHVRERLDMDRVCQWMGL